MPSTRPGKRRTKQGTVLSKKPTSPLPNLRAAKRSQDIVSHLKTGIREALIVIQIKLNMTWQPMPSGREPGGRMFSTSAQDLGGGIPTGCGEF